MTSIFNSVKVAKNWLLTFKMKVLSKKLWFLRRRGLLPKVSLRLRRSGVTAISYGENAFSVLKGLYYHKEVKHEPQEM